MMNLIGDRDGETYEAEFDYTRLNKQMLAVYNVIKDGQWHTLGGIADVSGAPEASVSARLRDLRKPRFGGLIIERKRLPSLPGLWLYRLNIEAARAA